MLERNGKLVVRVVEDVQANTLTFNIHSKNPLFCNYIF